MGRFEVGSLYALTFVSFQFYYYLSSFLSLTEAYAAFVAIYALQLIILFVIAVRIEGRSIGEFGFVVHNFRRTILFSIILVMLYFAANVDTGLFYGFTGVQRPDPLTFGFFFLSAPILAVSQEAIFRGFVFKRLLKEGTFIHSLLVSSALFALQFTNFSSFPLLGLNGIANYLLANTLQYFAVGIVMGLLFYKSNWSLLGPVLVRTGLIYLSSFSPVIAKGPPEFSFVFSLVGYVVLILAINGLMKEPRFLAKRYLMQKQGPRVNRFRQRDATKKGAQRFVLETASIVLLFMLLIIGLQFAHVPYPSVRAVASGSMQPTFSRGDLLVIVGVNNPYEVSVGDIVAYNSTGLSGPITHRVVSITAAPNGNLAYITKGDNNPTSDPSPVPFNRVEGLVLYRVPVLGYFVLDPLFAFSVIVVILVVSLLGTFAKGPEAPNRKTKIRPIVQG